MSECKFCEKEFLPEEKSLSFDKFRFHKKCLRKLRKIARKNKYERFNQVEEVIRAYKENLEREK